MGPGRGAGGGAAPVRRSGPGALDARGHGEEAAAADGAQKPVVQRARGGRGIRAAADPQASTVCGRFGRRDRARDRRRGRGVRGGGRAWLRPCPSPSPASWSRWTIARRGSAEAFPASLPEYRDWQREGAFLAAAAVVVSDRTLIAGDQPERVQMALVWGDLDGLTRMRPIVGRAFTPEESRPWGSRRSVARRGLLAGALRCGSGVVGRTLDVEGKPAQVVGVLRAVKVLFRRTDVQTWQPLPDLPMLDRGLHLLTVVGRLRPDVDIEVGEQRTIAMGAALRERRDQARRHARVSRPHLRGQPAHRAVAGSRGRARARGRVHQPRAPVPDARRRARTRVRGPAGARRGPAQLARQLFTEALCIAALGAAGAWR